MKKTILTILLLAFFMLSLVYSEENPKKSNDGDQTKSQSSISSSIKSIEKKLNALINEQDQQKKSIREIGKKIDGHTNDQKIVEAHLKETLEKNLEAIRSSMDTRLSDLQESQKKSASEIMTINQFIEPLRSDFFSGISAVEQRYLDSLKNNKIQIEKQISTVNNMIIDIGKTLTADQSTNYSSINLNLANLDRKIISVNEQLNKLLDHSKGDGSEKFQQVISEQLMPIQDVLKNLENSVTHVLNDAISKLNSEISDHIQTLKSDISNQMQQFHTNISRIKNSIKEDLEQMQSQIVENRHEQQLEVQSILKQLSQELNQHDKNISDHISITEKSLNHSHLTWLLYALMIVVVGLVIFIIWDRNSTVAPLLARIRRLEDNLVIEY
jgi:gas vesicle protein